jgi:hypothetical protein
MSSGSSFVIKVDVQVRMRICNTAFVFYIVIPFLTVSDRFHPYLQAQETFLLTCEHVVRGELSPGDGLRVRMMLPVGVGEFPASIIHMNTQIDVAILRVPGLTAAASLRFSPEDPIAGEGIAAVGYCDPDDLFAESSYSKIPAINPGCVRCVRLSYLWNFVTWLAAAAYNF